MWAKDLTSDHLAHSGLGNTYLLYTACLPLEGRCVFIISRVRAQSKERRKGTIKRCGLLPWSHHSPSLIVIRLLIAGAHSQLANIDIKYKQLILQLNPPITRLHHFYFPV